MGCDGSKVVDEIDTKAHAPPEELEFTDLETDTIRSTWPLLAENLETIGVKVFLRVFYEEPKVKNAFQKFGSLEEADLLRSTVFKEHAVKFMNIVDDLVDNMDQPKTRIQQTLMMLGAKHATFDGFKVEYFAAYSKSLIDVWEYTIGEEFIPEVKDCWIDLFDYLVKYMCQGYNLFINDMEIARNGKEQKQT